MLKRNCDIIPRRLSLSMSFFVAIASFFSFTVIASTEPQPVFASGSQAFSNTGSDQTWTVPAGVTEVQVYLRGAAGGTDQYNYGIGGKGAYVSAVLAVTPGSTLTIVAGSKGGNGASGINQAVYGGGGTYSANVWYTTSGGGASDIRVGGSALGNRVVVAGGGGGGVSFLSGGNAGTPTPGADGSPATPSGFNAAGGKGGTQAAGGAGGLRGSGCAGSVGSAGSLGLGGAAGTTGGGGGGGGYYGGGGGAMECNAGSGGGGSSWVNSSLASSATYALAANATSAGCVEIAWPTGTAAGSCTGTVTYSVTYNGNTNSSGTAPTDGSAYTSGQTVTVANNTGSLVKTGNTFNGWCTAQPAAGATCASVSGTSRATSSTFSISSGTTLYAVWTAASQTITYNNNLGTGTISDTTGNTGASVSLSSGSLFSRSGHTLSGWNTASGGGGTGYALSASITMPAGGLTLHAQWTAITFSVTYYGNTNSGGLAPTDGTAYTSGQTVTVANNTGSLVKTGYTFDGWCTAQPAAGATCASAAGISRPAISTFSISSSAALYAVWIVEVTTTSTTTSSTTSTIAPAQAPAPASPTSTTSTTSTTVPNGTVGINSWVMSASKNPAAPGSRFVLTTTISCGRQMSVGAAPYYPSMYYMVRSRPWINGVYSGPTLSGDRRTATFSVTVTAPTRADTYQMYAYGRDNPTGGTCTGNSFNFANSPMFSLVVGNSDSTTTSTSIAVGAPELIAVPTTSSTNVVVMPSITTTAIAPTTTTALAATTTPATTTPQLNQTAQENSNPVPSVQLNVSSSIQLPENSTAMMITRNSLLAIVQNLQITAGTIRVKTLDGVWQEQDIQNISDLTVPINGSSSVLEIEVLEQDSTIPISYSISISSQSGVFIWPTQILVVVLGLFILSFLVFFARRLSATDQPRR